MSDPSPPHRPVLDGIRIAVGQVRPLLGDVEANLRLAERYLRRAAGRGADLLALPECFLQGYSTDREILDAAVPADDQAIARLAELARRHRVALAAGFLERNLQHPEHPFNAAVVIDGAGRVLGTYRKTHLYAPERGIFAAGDAYPVFEVPLRDDRPPVTVGVAICADVEYPEPIRLLALRGVRLVLVLSANMDPFQAQQAANLPSRAIENNVFVALANTVDRRPDLHLFGGSGIAGPGGSLVSAGYDRPRLIVGELSDAEVEVYGGFGSYLRGRRPETYGPLVRP